MLNVLVLSRYYLPGYKGGGPIKTIKNLINSVSDDIRFSLITCDRDLGDASPYSSVILGTWNLVGPASILYVRTGLTGYVRIFDELWSRNYDIVYLNSFFSPDFSFFPLLLARVLRRKVVLGPRGEFSDGALALKASKKKLFIVIFKFLRLHKGTIFQASSDFEVRDIRKTLGNGVDVQVAEDIGAQEFAERLICRPAGPLRAVFISRISPKKNLLVALEMLEKVQHPLKFDIYGPIEDQNYWTLCKKVIARLPSHIEVKHEGSLNPDQVVRTLIDYDVFFFPTKGENYGHVIAEALCAGLPILIADSTPWRNLQDLGIGWDLSLNNPDAFGATLDELAEMPVEEHFELRKKVLAWAKYKFSQHDTIDANIDLFKYAYEKK